MSDIASLQQVCADLHPFVKSLLQGYAQAGPAGADEEIRVNRGSLMLAEACLRGLQRPADTRPLQLAVMGPTQVGKSTLVNLLLGEPLAEASPLAGFTVHPQAFVQGTPEPDWLAPFFTDWALCEPAQLTPDELQSYTQVTAGTAPADLPARVIWDTPDFDSLRAGEYQQGVLEVAALADALVLVLSREKYADLAVWNMLGLLQTLDKPLLICLNKMSAQSEPVIEAALRKRLDEAGIQARICALPHQPDLDRLAPADQPAQVDTLQQAVAELQQQALATRDGQGRETAALRLIKTHWPQWTAPLGARFQAEDGWHLAIEEAVEDSLQKYRKEFLDHEQRFDTFRRAILELLHLLELPGLAGALTKVRGWLTWPARRLFESGAAQALREHATGRKADELPSEERVLRDLIDQLYSRMQTETLRKQTTASVQTPYWQALSAELEQHREALATQFHAAIHHHHEAFQPEIERAAHELYEHLQEKPALLNSLRAARVTTDAAAVAIAVKTGGLGVNDLLFAPAMVALTSMLTEGALQGYMTKVSKQLKQRQLQAVDSRLFGNSVRPALIGLGDQARGPGLFAIPRSQFEHAQQQLESLRLD